MAAQPRTSYRRTGGKVGRQTDATAEDFQRWMGPLPMNHGKTRKLRWAHSVYKYFLEDFAAATGKERPEWPVSAEVILAFGHWALEDGSYTLPSFTDQIWTSLKYLQRQYGRDMIVDAVHAKCAAWQGDRPADERRDKTGLPGDAHQNEGSVRQYAVSPHVCSCVPYLQRNVPQCCSPAETQA